MNRRDAMKLGAGMVCGLYPALATQGAVSAATKGHSDAAAEQWGIFEVALPGPTSGNPFLDVNFSAKFQLQHRTVDVPGFYDGDGTYRVRFMPDATGSWTYETISNAKELNGKTGSFSCVAPSKGNHGPVQVAHRFHFQYADGTPYFPFGTTCYSWSFLGEELEQKTLDTLRTSGFNKVRMCILPKGSGKAPVFGKPYEKDASGKFDLTRFNPAYFQYLEKRIQDLMKLGVEADLILFHPYDSLGFKAMPPDADDRYLRYVIARLASYRNVWWSIANEYDLVKTKTPSDWDRFFRIVQEADPSQHLRSIHHSKVIYDNSKPWVTHASLQTYAFEKAAEWHEVWGKPIIFDEIQYEGNVNRRWGNLPPQEMVRRFWLSIVAGSYSSHGETFVSTDGTPAWSDGGTLHGESAPRIAFLRKIVEESTTVGLDEYEGAYYLSAGQPKQVYLYYFDFHQPADYIFPLPDGISFKADLIDPWAMTITEIPGTFTGKSKIKLPSKPYMAVRLRKTT